jgi:hypothetical protein
MHSNKVKGGMILDWQMWEKLKKEGRDRLLIKFDELVKNQKRVSSRAKRGDLISASS